MSRRQEVDDLILRMYGKSDTKIAAALIKDEIVMPPKSRMTADETSRWRDGVRRTVNNRRRAITKGWKSEPLPKPGDPVEARSYIAKLQTRIEELDDIVEDKGTKSTARMNAYAEIRQLETLIAQTKRVDTGGRRRADDDDGDDAPQSKLPFVGVVIDFANVPAEERAAIAADLERQA